VSLKILFADDSMTAQNMGKKILTEAGYEVVAVSNGAAAVKKIAEHKPDIIILDVYMPGYSGLEVCEKVRASLDTMKTPVLLTVGKMEPYKPEDANRVKADGVIIKPFEASDLLAIMKKFEERIAQNAVPPPVEQTVRLERQYQEEAIAAPEPVEHHATGKTGMQPMVEVPDHMAGAAAFNDMLSADSSMAAHHFGVSSPAAAFETSVILPAPPIPTPEYELTGSWKEEEKPEPTAAAPTETKPEIAPMAVEAAPEPVSAEHVSADAGPETVAMEALPEPEASMMPAASEASPAGDVSQPSRPQFIPVYKEPEHEATSYEVLPTGAPPTGEIEIPREPELQETANETTRNTVADHVEPGLLSPQEKYSVVEKEPEASWSGGSSAATPAEETSAPTMEAAPAESSIEPLPAIRASGEIADSDFEARVAAAMAAYSHATEPAPAQAEMPESPIAALAEIQPEPPVDAAQAVEAAPATEAAPSFEYYPSGRVPEAVETVPEAADIATHEIIATPVSEPSAHEVAITPDPAVVHDVVTAGVEAAAVAAAAETGADHHNIAQAIHRVMERLKPELVEEIMRELRSKK
jgi:twitching motility two-component system response regulator PilG